jgi:hypothetical protein
MSRPPTCNHNAQAASSFTKTSPVVPAHLFIRKDVTTEQRELNQIITIYVIQSISSNIKYYRCITVQLYTTVSSD